jgi:hypothetical protein
MKLLAISIFLLLFLVIGGYGAEITDGNDVVIIGQGKLGTTPPYDISSHPFDINQNPIGDYMDPSQYDFPSSPKPPPPPNGNNGDIVNNQTGRNQTTIIRLSGEVQGTGGFMRWKSVNNEEELREKHRSSASYGNIDSSSNIILIREDVKQNKTRVLFSNDVVNFFWHIL